MAWCTCSKVTVALIVGIVCIVVGNDMSVYFGVVCLAYAALGILYNMLLGCIKVCVGVRETLNRESESNSD
jgi:hypothetical protein